MLCLAASVQLAQAQQSTATLCKQAFSPAPPHAVARLEGGYCFVPASCPGLDDVIASGVAALSRLHLDLILQDQDRSGHVDASLQPLMVLIPDVADRLSLVSLPQEMRATFLRRRFPPLTTDEVAVAWGTIDRAIEACQDCPYCRVPFGNTSSLLARHQATPAPTVSDPAPAR